LRIDIEVIGALFAGRAADLAAGEVVDDAVVGGLGVVWVGVFRHGEVADAGAGWVAAVVAALVNRRWKRSLKCSLCSPCEASLTYPETESKGGLPFVAGGTPTVTPL
jgi:hypothetical protein